MVEPVASARGGGPTLFRQIATRLALFTLLFAALDVAIVVVTYSRQPEALAEELLTLEASKARDGAELPAELQAGPPGAKQWSARYVEPGAPELQPAMRGTPRDGASPLVDWTRRETAPRGYRISGVRAVDDGGKRRWLAMQFEADGIRPYIPVIVNEIVQHVLLPLIPLSVLLLLFNVFAVRRVLHPLRRAEREVDALDPGNAVMRLSEPLAPREVNTLVRAVNRALARLDGTLAILRGFTANAAHELRTPLSIMQLSLDRLPAGKVRDDLQADTRYLTRLVEQMLDLAQADALASAGHNPFDLADVGREVVAAMAPKAFAEHRELRFESRGDTQTVGHAEAVFRIYRNLIDNALKHAPGTTPIDVTPARARSFRFATTASGSHPRTCRTCSSDSGERIGVRRTARAWVWGSSNGSSRRTAARSPSKTPMAAVRSSPFAFPPRAPGNRDSPAP